MATLIKTIVFVVYIPAFIVCICENLPSMTDIRKYLHRCRCTICETQLKQGKLPSHHREEDIELEMLDY